jgi:hypothetical protein
MQLPFISHQVSKKLIKEAPSMLWYVKYVFVQKRHVVVLMVALPKL